MTVCQFGKRFLLADILMKRTEITENKLSDDNQKEDGEG